MDAEPRLRIGELSRRAGVSTELLRAWERRYGLLEPTRSPSGFRLYSEADERRVAAMRSHLDAGLSAAEAARLATQGTATLEEPAGPRAAELTELREQLSQALLAFDERAAHALLDTAFGRYPLDLAISEVVLPYLHDLGERWARAEATVAQEHFGASVVRTRVLGLARGWNEGIGPRAVLACPSGEMHDIGLMCLGLALWRRGWRITYLGADTPIPSVAETAVAAGSATVVLASVFARWFLEGESQIGELGTRWPVWVAGPGATQALADRVGARLLPGGPVAAASALAPPS